MDFTVLLCFTSCFWGAYSLNGFHRTSLLHFLLLGGLQFRWISPYFSASLLVFGGGLQFRWISPYFSASLLAVVTMCVGELVILLFDIVMSINHICF